MYWKRLGAAAVLFVVAVAAFVAGTLHAQSSAVKRTPLGKMDVPGSNYEVVVAKTEVSADFKAGRHFHPGLVTTYILDGELMLALDGQQARTFKAGDALQVPERAIHDEGAVGGKPATMIAVYLVEKGKSIAQPAQ